MRIIWQGIQEAPLLRGDATEIPKSGELQKVAKNKVIVESTKCEFAVC